MTPEAVNAALDKIGLGMTALSRLLQTGRSTIYRWKEGGTDGCNALLLRLVASGKVTIEDVEEAHD